LRTLITLLALGACALGPAQAAVFQSVVVEKSSITFSYKQMGVPMQGRFGKFAAQLSLDTEKADRATGRIDIDLASIDAGSADANQELAGKTWFHVAAHPLASYVLQGLRETGPARYEALGRLTIKGRTKELRTPLTLTKNGISGSLVVNRADFAIGEGMWAKPDIVGNEIQVIFNLTIN